MAFFIILALIRLHHGVDDDVGDDVDDDIDDTGSHTVEDDDVYAGVRKVFDDVRDCVDNLGGAHVDANHVDGDDDDGDAKRRLCGTMLSDAKRP